MGVRAHRQSIIRGYIVDFYIPAWGLVIELDGSFHDNRKAYDDTRTSVMESLGLRVIRFKNEEVQDAPFAPIDRIKANKPTIRKCIGHAT